MYLNLFVTSLSFIGFLVFWDWITKQFSREDNEDIHEEITTM